MKTILSHANLIDCVEPKVRLDTAVLIEDGRIRAILPSVEARSVDDAQVIDLKGGYLMPGLWDVHIHPDYLSLDEMPLADQVTLFGHRLAAALTESGIVGLRVNYPFQAATMTAFVPGPQGQPQPLNVPIEATDQGPAGAARMPVSTNAACCDPRSD